MSDEPLPIQSLPRLANQSALHASGEEVVIDFTFAGLPGPNVGVERVALTWPAAKRLLLTLQHAVVSFEKDFGAINPDPQKRPNPQSNGEA